jgi:hypothetical protein
LVLNSDISGYSLQIGAAPWTVIQQRSVTLPLPGGIHTLRFKQTSKSEGSGEVKLSAGGRNVCRIDWEPEGPIGGFLTCEK